MDAVIDGRQFLLSIGRKKGQPLSRKANDL